MPATDSFSIRFPDLDLAEQGRCAESLRDAMLDSTPNVKVDVQKSDPTTQDLGTVLIGFFGTPAVIILARGIANWMAKRGQTIEIEIGGDKTTFRASGPVDENATRIVEALSRHKS